MSKEKYGVITNVSLSQIYVDKRPFKRNPETDEVRRKEKISVGDEVIFTYDTRDRNLIHIRRKPKPPKDIEADGEQAKNLKLYMEQQKKGDPIPPVQTTGNSELHIQQGEAAPNTLYRPLAGITPSGVPANNTDKVLMHMHNPAQRAIEPRMWIPDDEKNNFILMQSVLARAVDVVNAYQHEYGKTFKEDTLTLRCNLIEGVADRLFEYVKKKVESERVNKNERTNP